MDFKCSIFTMITDIEDDDYQSIISKQEEEEQCVWRFLHLIEIDTFIEENFQDQLHVPVENCLSGGQQNTINVT
jgi:hypothetical protein